MGKQMPLGMIQMYVHMAEEEFEPVIAMAEARNTRLVPAIRRKVYEEMGVYELEAKRAGIMQQVNEIDEQILLIKGRVINQGGGFYGRPETREGGMAQKEVDRRLGDVDGMVSGLHAMKERIIKGVKLSGSTPEIRKTFDLLTAELALVKEQLAALPPVEFVLKQIGARPFPSEMEIEEEE